MAIRKMYDAMEEAKEIRKTSDAYIIRRSSYYKVVNVLDLLSFKAKGWTLVGCLKKVN